MIAYMACIVGVMWFTQNSALELRNVWHNQSITLVVQPLIDIKKGWVACSCKPRVCLMAMDYLTEHFSVSSSSFIVLSSRVSVSDSAE